MVGMIRNSLGIRVARKVTGFSLIEIAIVLLILAILATTLGSTMSGLVEARRRDETIQNMQKVEDAIVSFVSTTKRMPCPADGSLTSTDPNWGLESPGRSITTGCPPALLTGVVPWRTLGITQADVIDGWQSMYTYRIQLTLGADNAMTMSDCDPAGSAGAAGSACATCLASSLAACTRPLAFLAGKGLVVQNVAGVLLAAPDSPTAPTGAAFVLVSTGPSQGNSFNANGVLVAGNPAAGTEEARNQNNQALQTYYVDDELNATQTALHFDDIVRRPTVATIINKAGLGPRAHL